MNGKQPFIFCARTLFWNSFICSAGTCFASLPAKSLPLEGQVALDSSVPSLNLPFIQTAKRECALGYPRAG